MQYYYRYYNMTKNFCQFKKIIIVVSIICFFSYVFIDFSHQPKLVHFRDRFDKTQAYFVDTPGCRMPYFNVIDNSILQYIIEPKNYTCSKALTRAANNGSWLSLNMNDTEILERYNVSDLGQAKCYYNEIRRKKDRENQYMEKVEIQLHTKQPIEINPGVEFIRVQCENTMGDIFYKDFHFFIVEKEAKKSIKTESIKSVNVQGFSSTFDSISFGKQKLKKPREQAFRDKVSVMILGIDSVSHLNFLRQMKQTTAFIRKHLSNVEFWGYNKVGDNTYPNLVPVLSGLDENELDTSCLFPYNNYKYDKCAFIWKNFKKAGYKTAYAEDVARLGLFNFCRSGFKVQPTDYYLRPIVYEMEDYISYKPNGNVQLCKAGRRSVDVLLEFIHKLIPLFKRQLFFSFFWSVSLTHEYLNMPMLLDTALTKLLQAFADEGIFNNTVVFLMSDHGLRYGYFRRTYQGMMEERQPLLIALYPKWLQQKYPLAVANLKQNSKRLTTHYDLHATMMDLLDLRNLETIQLKTRAGELLKAENLPRSISLFLPVPSSRSCELAGIASHWCTCHQQQELATNDELVERAAYFIVKLMNEKLKSYSQCRMLYLNSISKAIIVATHHKILKEVTTDYGIDITVRVQTIPGLVVTEDPEFTDVIENITVPAGRNVKLACSVKNLGTYKVAWMHFEQSAILTVHNHVITRNPRISVTHDKHDKHRTWFLHINNVQEEDKGRYMCQINTVTAKTQYGFVKVVVPPNIDDALTSSDVIVREGDNVTLRCKAKGSPEPSIKWKRDDGNKIVVNKTVEVIDLEGEALELERISRLHMGAYLCIASNGVPPSVSKRIKVSVDFSPMVWIPHQLVGIPMYFNVTLECFVEANPTSLNYWTRENDQMITESMKYKTETIPGNPTYKATMRLTITNIQRSDYGSYKCVAKNPRGEMDGTIKLYMSSPPTTIPPPTTTTLRRTTTQTTRNGFNTAIYGETPTNSVIVIDKSGSKYQSNLNEIDKSEQKLTGDSPKGYDWQEKDHNAACSCRHNNEMFLATLCLLWSLNAAAQRYGYSMAYLQA